MNESCGLMLTPLWAASTPAALGLGNGASADREVCLPVWTEGGCLFFNTYLHWRALVEKNYQAHQSNP